MRLVKKIVATFAYLILLLPAAVHTAEQVVLYGTPTTKVESSSKETRKFRLSEKQKLKSRLMIVKRAGQYFWASREYRSLVHRISGAFHYFIEPNGGGYIKVVDRRLLFESNNPRYLYVEHTSMWLWTTTYWGSAVKFSP